jgi:hypothetical protein
MRPQHGNGLRIQGDSPALAGYMATADSSTHLVVLARCIPLGVSRLVLARLLAMKAAPATSPR